MTSVVIADDQALVRDGLRLILELAGVDVVGEAGDGSEALEMVRRLAPDVCLMDIRMPGQDGVEATRRIVAEGLATRVLVLTTFDLDEHVYDALRAGASGFLLKDVTAERLVDAVARAAAGETPLSEAIVARVVRHFVDGRPHTPPAASQRLAALSDREREVLALVGAGRSNPEIAEDLVISIATVKSHVRHILAKLDLRDRVQAVVLAQESGLVGTPPDEA